MHRVFRRTLISGFVVRGLAPKKLLLRAAGPALVGFGVESPLEQPVLVLYDHEGNTVATNAGWSTPPAAASVRTAAQQAGAFAFPEGSDDAALLVNLAPGVYTAHITGRAAETGVALFECYDLDPTSGAKSRVSNLSTRAFVAPGEKTVIPGLHVPGGRTMLLRVVGPGLTAFGVSDVLADPRFRLMYPGLTTGLIGGAVVTAPQPGPWYEDWGLRFDYAHAFTPDDISEAAWRVGAFPLSPGSKDAACLIVLPGGAYSIEVGSANGGSGVVLVEIYDVEDL